MARPPTRGLKALILQQLLPHVFGARRHKPQLAVLNLSKRNGRTCGCPSTLVANYHAGTDVRYPKPYSIRPRFLLY